ncbi:MAG TPA: TonB-dependent receptor plug domain-containing protein, partial [Vicinamibacteria bacterium]|nr:TonB-dependent receptor plug domain-containing protein [Vicinamibacteria bacterium]
MTSAPAPVAMGAIRMKSLLFAALLSLPALALAQEKTVLSGVVTTRDDGLPLPGAVVAIEALNLSATTDAEGRYTLELPPGAPESVEVKVTAGGLVPRTWTFRPGGGAITHDFAMSLTYAEEITVGSRAAGAEAEKAVPVDVLTARQIESAGYTETMQVIQALAPSFNFPRTTIADGSASVRPATLRGLGPDQVLVLVNGKRRHTTALVHVNATVGRGSTGVDLNAIPVAAIERVEILREGAAAQYGSDAIAGVMNIVLKSGKQPLTLSVKGGQTFTDQ